MPPEQSLFAILALTLHCQNSAPSKYYPLHARRNYFELEISESQQRHKGTVLLKNWCAKLIFFLNWLWNLIPIILTLTTFTVGPCNQVRVVAFSFIQKNQTLQNRFLISACNAEMAQSLSSLQKSESHIFQNIFQLNPKSFCRICICYTRCIFASWPSFIG